MNTKTKDIESQKLLSKILRIKESTLNKKPDNNFFTVSKIKKYRASFIKVGIWYDK